MDSNEAWKSLAIAATRKEEEIANSLQENLEGNQCQVKKQYYEHRNHGKHLEWDPIH